MNTSENPVAPAEPWLDQLSNAVAARYRVELSVQRAASLARCSTLRVGGEAEALVDVRSLAALTEVLDLCSREAVPLHFVGRGANILFPDEGLRGVVLRLGGEFRDFTINGTRVEAGAGALLSQVAKTCATRGLVGLEALAGFPASVGGAVTMNAGCYGTEIKDWLHSVEALVEVENDEGCLHWQQRVYQVEELEARYRWTRFREMKAVVVKAFFCLEAGDSTEALQRLDRLNRKRWDSLPSGKPNAGSIFRNPEGDYAGRLLEASGMKGLVIGGAAFSEKHANVIVNLGGATAADVTALMTTAQRKVREQFGIDLVAELVRM